MMLKQNGLLLAQMPLRLRSGTLSDARFLYGRTERLNVLMGEGIASDFVSVPDGHLAPSAWILPIKTGGMSSYTTKAIQVTLSAASLIQGMSLAGTDTISLSVNAAVGSLIVSSSGTADISLSLNAAGLAGILDGSGTAAMSITLGAPVLDGIISTTGTADISLSLNAAVPRGLAFISGDDLTSGVLTAAQVWAYTLTGSNSAQDLVVAINRNAKIIPALA